MSEAWLLDEYHIVTPEIKKKRRKKKAPGSRRMLNKKKRLLLLDPICKYCKKELSLSTATLDHVIPKSKGGRNTIDNLVLACDSCNKKKGDSLV